MSEAIDHDMTQAPVCPWCGHEHGGCLDTVGHRMNCDSCGKGFTVEVHTAYSAERIEDE